MRDNLGRFIKGHSGSPKTEFKNGEHRRENHHNWNGGKHKSKNGYIWILAPNHPKVRDKKRKYIYEHVLIMEKEIGRYLNKGECVHHVNRIRTDNRVENLKLCSSQAEHFSYHNHEKINISKELFDQEIKNGKSIPKIAKELGIHFSTLYRRKQKWDKKSEINYIQH